MLGVDDASEEVTIARDYQQAAVVVETPNSEQRLNPDVARGIATTFRKTAEAPGSPSGILNRIATELESAADDVENG
jgi:hypothetical protein